MGEEKLIEKATLGDKDAINQIMINYKPLVRSICRKYFLLKNVSQEDLIQEGMIGLFNAVTSFSDKLNTSFKTYATTCIKNNIQSAVIKNNRFKNLPLNTYFSITNQGKILLSNNLEEDNNNEEEYGFYLESQELSPEDSMLFREKLKEMVDEINGHLSRYESKVLKLFVSGVNYIQIAKILKKEPKSIDNALSRIKIKLRDLRGNA